MEMSGSNDGKVDWKHMKREVGEASPMDGKWGNHNLVYHDLVLSGFSSKEENTFIWMASFSIAQNTINNRLVYEKGLFRLTSLLKALIHEEE